MNKVLHIGATLEHGGVEKFLYNIYSNFDREKIRFDFLVSGYEINYYESVFKEMGSNIFHIPRKSDNLLKSIKEFRNIIRSEKYDVVHIHTLSTLSFLNAMISRFLGVKKVIVHSHNFLLKTSLKQRIFRPFLNFFATDYFACSNMAGEYLFGKNKKFFIINNGIETDEYDFNENIRIEYRKSFALQDKFVIGHVGRFTNQKNHSFLIDIFKKVNDVFPDTCLLLVGAGELEIQIKTKVERLGLNDSVIFAGIRSDVPSLMQAMDLFVLPSNYEGLGIVLIEAQAAGLKCISVKGSVPNETAITNLISFIPLEKRIWVESIMNNIHFYNRESKKDQIIKANFDVEFTSKWVENYYTN